MPQDSAPCIEFHGTDLRVSYGLTVALNIPYLHASGRIIAVIGHNGSGKSTFIKTLLGLLSPRSGEMKTYFHSRGEHRVLVPERDMAFSPENGAVFADVSVESYVKLWCRIKKHRGDYYRREGAQVIEQLEIAPLMKKLGRELSKGQRRRVQIAVGFLAEPNLFLFDEPFDGLDIAQSNQLSSILLERSEQMSMVVSSHRMEVVERLADMIIVLEKGTVIACGPVDDVCAQLCGQSVLIPNAGEAATRILPILREAFASCLVHTIGNQVSITGTDISVESLAAILQQLELTDLLLRPARPSLVDAMHYHLRKIH